MSFINNFLQQSTRILETIDQDAIELAVDLLSKVRERGGRLFLVGSGGGAGHASHAACDFRKVCGIEAYCPTDNVSELTARINDEGWDSSIAAYLKGSRFNKKDCLLVFSVGGGSEEKNISVNLVQAIKLAKEQGATIIGIVGRDGGYTAKQADACIIIPTVDSHLITPHTESMQALVWHLFVSHPRLQIGQTKWESVSTAIVKNSQPYDLSSQLETQVFTTKIFADGADREGMLEMYQNPMISGFTTNPTLMKKAGVKDYKAFALDILDVIRDRPISFEVLADDFPEMERQAKEIASWGENVYVKIPITNSKQESSIELIERLSNAKVKVNVTALMTINQVDAVLPALRNSPGAYISYFAGRVADTGRDPLPVLRAIMKRIAHTPNVELIWASPRELFNVVQANQIGCHVITVTNDILKKLNNLGKDLSEFSLETVMMFYNDAQAAGLTLTPETEERRPQIETIRI